ncbi:PspC domain-containing protein [Vallicoccus soli]|uniref:PspC domain-containing protein n=1 Tax=Vallicoccus soli TaxID=2339232 RepID=A0A3A3Z2N2_9ACTN|nr:PspC domain-containing protein [Vallicoccus soli]RJK96949.1 PspC domain-containing protein [Vallicoccus soli]
MARSNLPAGSAWVRPRRRLIGGVCGAIARGTGLGTGTVRVLFVVSCVLPGPQVLLYLALWFLLPAE